MKPDRSPKAKRHSAKTALHSAAIHKNAEKPGRLQKKSASAKKPPEKKKSSPRRRGRRPPSVSPERVRAIFSRFAEIEPDPKGELEHKDAFTLLVAVVLSAQATDAGVNKATRQLFAVADTPEKMVALGEEKIRDFIKTIGLFRNKAKNVLALSQQLIEDHGGQVPDNVEALEKLPGVGRKTANVVLNVWFGKPTMAVDTHVFRVSHRLGLSNGRTPDEVERDLLAIVPEEFAVPAHHWLILHGRYLCKARKPECWRCPVRDLCPFEEKTPAPVK
jgi:endonuclease III